MSVVDPELLSCQEPHKKARSPSWEQQANESNIKELAAIVRLWDVGSGENKKREGFVVIYSGDKLSIDG